MSGTRAALVVAVVAGCLGETLATPLAAQGGQPTMSANSLTATVASPDTTALTSGKSAAATPSSIMTMACGNSAGSCNLRIEAAGTGLGLEWSLVGVSGTGCTGSTSTTFVALAGRVLTGVGVANGKSCVATIALRVSGLSWTTTTTVGGTTANPTVQKATFTFTKP